MQNSLHNAPLIFCFETILTSVLDMGGKSRCDANLFCISELGIGERGCKNGQEWSNRGSMLDILDFVLCYFLFNPLK